jgi:hypothetical protein
MLAFVILSVIFFVAFLCLMGIGKRHEIMQNWDKYHRKPLYMMTAFLYKPDGDPRSRFEFMQDNFRKNMQSLVADTFKIVMAPLFDIFQVTGGGVVGSMRGTSQIQSIVATMMESFNQVFSIFDNRFKATLYQFSSTYRKLQTSMERIWAVTAATIYQSIAMVSSILSTMDLIIKIVITILVILIAIVLFLFLFLWPVIPLVLGVVGILVTAGMGAAVGGMASTFCFTEETRIVMADGTTKPIHAVQIGDELATGKVTGRLEFLQSSPLYELHGVRVTGTHIVWYEGTPIHVADHPIAAVLPTEERRLYCLNTETQRISVQSTVGPLLFADWEELGDADQLAWNAFVFRTLNPGATWNTEEAVIAEGGFPGTTMIPTPDGPIPMESLRPGMNVLDATGAPTRVLGIVELEEATMDAVWREEGGCWKQGMLSQTVGPVDPSGISDSVNRITEESTSPPKPFGYTRKVYGPGRTLVTEAGTFQTPLGPVRDFTDVGVALSDSYEWVLEALRKTGA